jgi:hypothetical protein
MATADNQPGIVNAGVVDVDANGRPQIYFDGTNDVLTIASPNANTLYPTFESANAVTIISNGNFASKTGWTGISGLAWSVANNEAVITNLGASADTYKLYQNSSLSVTAGHRYYMRAEMQSNSSSDSIGMFQSGNNTTKAHSGSGNYETLELIHKSNATGTTSPRALSTNRTGDISANPVKIKNIVIIDITNLSSVDITAQPLMINAVFNNAGQTGYVICKNLDSTTALQYAISYYDTNKLMWFGLEDDVDRHPTATNSTLNNAQYIYSGAWGSNTAQGYVKGSASGSSASYSGTLTSRANMNIGARSNNADGTAWAAFFKGYISEIIILTSTTGRSKIERNQGKYFNQMF